MPRPEYVLDTTNPRLALTALARLAAGYAIIQAAGIAWGGKDRWAKSPALKVALAMPWAPYSWAAGIGVAGIVTILAIALRRPTVAAAGLFLLGLWHAFFALTLAEALTGPAPTTGPPAYGLIAASCWLLAALYRASPRRWGHGPS